ncbi:MAG: hypothetical protein Kapaf2KO_19490 [Candidatus Kapaibacteriales bacterium]
MAYTTTTQNMFASSRHETPSGFNINIPWDSNAFKGLVGGVSITLIILFLIGYFEPDDARFRVVRENRIPIEILSLGSGDGTGLKSGNLTEEGAKAKGAAVTNNLEDSQIARSDLQKTKTQANTSDDLSDNVNPVKDLSSNEKIEKNTNKGTDSKSVGATDGDIMGSGLRKSGTGRGAGDGFGDIDWGGGGNRIVINKVVPKMPPGVQASAQITLKIRVLPNGSVASVTPITKADPLLERAATEALKKWRFNPLDSETIMEGVIPFTFILR